MATRIDTSVISDEEYTRLLDEYADAPNPVLAERYGVKVSWLEFLARRHGLKKSNPGLPPITPGDRFGLLRVVEKTDVKFKRDAVFLCECECGKAVRVKSQNLRKGKTTSCAACEPGPTVGREHHRRTGFGEIGGSMWSRIKGHARERGIAFELTVEYAYRLFLAQSRRCALTGFEIAFPVRFKDTSGGTASLDRVDSSRGYVEGNVQWTHKIANFMKGVLSQEEFIRFCHAVAQRQPLPNLPEGQ
jgi:hypothetical protein